MDRPSDMRLQPTDPLWTHPFRLVCASHFLLYASIYLMLPVWPLWGVRQAGWTDADVGRLCACFVLGLLLPGCLYSYLADNYARKKLATWTYVAVVALPLAFEPVADASFAALAVLTGLRGALFGLAATLSATMAIDVTPTTRRDEASVGLSWAARFGRMAGAPVGLLLYARAGIELTGHVALATGFAGWLALLCVETPFRAPIGGPLCSTDRFVLCRGWLPAFNWALASFVFGMGLKSAAIALAGMPMEMAGGVAALLPGGALLALATGPWMRRLGGLSLQTGAGFVLIAGAAGLWQTALGLGGAAAAALAGGMGLGWASGGILRLLVELSEHSRRATAVTTYRLAWEVGVYVGLWVGWQAETASWTAVAASLAALLLYGLATRPYVAHRRLR